MDKYKFMAWAFGLTAIFSTIAFILVGIFSPIEAGMSVFGHVLKTVFMWAWVTAILETMMWTVGQLAWHWIDANKEQYGERWFIEGIKDDWKYIKSRITWKKVGIFVGFFVVVLAVFGILEYLVP